MARNLKEGHVFQVLWLRLQGFTGCCSLGLQTPDYGAYAIQYCLRNTGSPKRKIAFFGL